MIGSKQLAPSELLASCIARIESVDHAVNAMVARDFARAHAAALKADDAIARGAPLGPLHGLPIGIKDLEEIEGLVTTHGSPIFRKAGKTPRLFINADIDADSAQTGRRGQTPDDGTDDGDVGFSKCHSYSPPGSMVFGFGLSGKLVSVTRRWTDGVDFGSDRLSTEENANGH